MAAKRMNVLVYSGLFYQRTRRSQTNVNVGTGCTIDAVRHCVYTFRRILSTNYAVIPVDGNAIIKEPWPSTCAYL